MRENGNNKTHKITWRIKETLEVFWENLFKLRDSAKGKMKNFITVKAYHIFT